MRNRPFNFRKGEVILCDKPLEWTSFNVVHVIRRTISRDTKEKLKVGHAGTLDPLATGLLIVCTGRATKTIMRIQETDKEYTGTIRIGSTTPSYDLETEVNQTFDVSGITDEMIHEAAAKQNGPIMQSPPLFSAKQVDGKRAYKLARKGDTRIFLPGGCDHEFRSTKSEEMKIALIWILESHAKGTYIRPWCTTLVRTQQWRTFTALRRTKIGDLIEDAIPDELKVMIKKQDSSIKSSRLPSIFMVSTVFSDKSAPPKHRST